MTGPFHNRSRIRLANASIDGDTLRCTLTVGQQEEENP